MSNPGNHRPPHRAVARALSQLDFTFEESALGWSSDQLRGFGPQSVVEVLRGPPMTVSLLFSASLEARILARSTICVITLASVLSIDFAGWLAREMRRNGLTNPWRTSQYFGHARVSAEFLTEDAVLLTIETAS